MTSMHVKMSFKEDLPTKSKFVFVILCDMANTDNVCWPGIRRLSAISGISEEEVNFVINLLIERRLVERRSKIISAGETRINAFIVYPKEKQEKIIKNKQSNIKTNYFSQQLESKNKTTEKNKCQPVEISNLISEIRKSLI